MQVPYAESRRPRSVVIADDSFQLVKTFADQIIQVVVKSTEKLYGSKCFRCFLFFLFAASFDLLVHLKANLLVISLHRASYKAH